MNSNSCRKRKVIKTPSGERNLDGGSLLGTTQPIQVVKWSYSKKRGLNILNSNTNAVPPEQNIIKGSFTGQTRLPAQLLPKGIRNVDISLLSSQLTEQSNIVGKKSPELKVPGKPVLHPIKEEELTCLNASLLSMEGEI